ncbi:hypothetical protein NDA13_000186 [Ustilago tritici]|nr:hypothetical protein NDA13_000186 [Ustilago tritici]
MAAESKDQSLHGLETGLGASSSATSWTCLPPLAILQRRRRRGLVLLLLLLLLLLPSLYLVLLYTPPLDQLDVEGRSGPAVANERMGSKGKASPSRSHLELDLEEGTRFSAEEESILLLLHLLGQQANYTLPDDWQDIFLDRTPLDTGILALLKGGPRNRFTQLLTQVALAPRAQKSRLPAGHSILDDAYQVYSLSRGDWVHRMRSSLGLTVFSKSYCPYSQKAKSLLDSLGAVYTVYEVDLRPDGHNLQTALARLTGHATFPTILARDKVLGGNDDLQDNIS